MSLPRPIQSGRLVPFGISFYKHSVVFFLLTSTLHNTQYYLDVSPDLYTSCTQAQFYRTFIKGPESTMQHWNSIRYIPCSVFCLPS
jgi:hypothetical protein